MKTEDKAGRLTEELRALIQEGNALLKDIRATRKEIVSEIEKGFGDIVERNLEYIAKGVIKSHETLVKKYREIDEDVKWEIINSVAPAIMKVVMEQIDNPLAELIDRRFGESLKETLRERIDPIMDKKNRTYFG